MNKLDRMARELNDEFRSDLKRKMKEEFDIEIMSEWNWGIDRLVSTRVDGKDFTVKEIEYMKAYQDGYADAKHRVLMASQY